MLYKNLLKARIDDGTADKLTEISRKSGLSKSAVLRGLINGTSIRASPPADYQAMISELRRIGVNLNQIALVANATGDIQREAYTQQACEINRAVLDIRRAVEL